LKETYEVRQIIEEEKVKRHRLRKVIMLEICDKYNQIQKSLPQIIYKAKPITFHFHQKSLASLFTLQNNLQFTLDDSDTLRNNLFNNSSNDQTSSNNSIFNSSINKEMLEEESERFQSDDFNMSLLAMAAEKESCNKINIR
jgi:hypothetical protein